ncbi:DUF2777 domain-containing protein [Metabacillus idriensis]|uniref:DUF2777 family protein n=1 Tax=Metabacillus idriensis TaxID=324768 RepID=UPI0008A8712C|nr:DUF2777 family protein [Metabacillus idriensis]MCM3595305.1 DUF2777 domain-containing protein [Metabacillus idriensis]OHR72348.1 hypothetical protein HMPREF3291_22060 [Bacillus sp. HMSC76G11]
MLSNQKHRLLERQERAHATGSIEISEDQEFLFYDDVNEEVSILQLKPDETIEILLNDCWYTGTYLTDGQLSVPMGIHQLKTNDMLRIQKKVPFALEYMLKEFSDDSFLAFTAKLNALSFSIHDCIYSYNHMVFQEGKNDKQGVSFFQFDNEEAICGVQHHFSRGSKNEDRFEFTTCTGKRALLTQIQQ